MTTPLGAHLDARGARRPEGSTIIESFGDPVAEHGAVRDAAGWAHLASLALVALTGKDRVDWLQGLFTNDLKMLAPGQGCYGVHLTVKGRMVADFPVYARPDELVLAVAAAQKARLLEDLDRFLFREEVQIQDRADAWTTLAVHGPRSGAIAAAALGGHLPDLPEDHFVERPFSGETLLAATSRDTGEPGYLLHVPLTVVVPLWDAIFAAGAAQGGRPIGAAALRTLRVEAGRPAYGEDMDENTIPIEAGLEPRAISYTKGCYVGQEVIARIHSQGHVNRHLRGLLLEGAVLPTRGDKLKAGDREAGWVTTAVASPTVGRSIALAYVRRDFANAGTPVLVATSGGDLPAEVRLLPFVGS